MGIIGILFEIAFHLIGAFLKAAFGILWLLIKYIGLPLLCIAIIVVIFKICTSPQSPAKEAPPNLKNSVGTDRQCRNCFYCGRHIDGIEHLCTKYHTGVDIYKVCDDYKSILDVLFGIK